METLETERLGDETLFLSPAEDTPENIRREVWQIAWPSVLTFMLMTTNMILDRAFVGRLGRDALAAVGVGGQMMFLLVSISMGITVGTTALVARFTGARDPVQAERATGQSLALSLAIGIAGTLGAYAGLGPYVHAVGLSPQAQEQCRTFVTMALLGMIPMFAAAALGAAFRGLGDTRTPLKVMLCANLVHVVGDWILIFGHLGAPRLGLRGAGIALSASSVVSLFAYVYLLRGSILHPALENHHLKLTMLWTRRILKIGIPAAFTALLRVTSLMGFTGILSRTSEKMAAVAALPIGLTAESIAFMPGLGFSVAASALVGQALGARDPEKAERYGWVATWQAVAIMSAMGALFFIAARPFVAIFTHDPLVAQLAVDYLRIMAISEPMLGMGMVLTGALQGAGETVKPAIVTALSFWVFRLPVAWYLAIFVGYNTFGAWIAMSTTTVLGGVLSILLFRSDSWKRVRL